MAVWTVAWDAGSSLAQWDEIFLRSTTAAICAGNGGGGGGGEINAVIVMGAGGARLSRRADHSPGAHPRLGCFELAEGDHRCNAGS